MPPVESVFAENKQLKQRIAELETQIAWLRRQMFAGSKSEKIDPAQLELMLKGLKEQQDALEQEKETINYQRNKPKGRKSREENYENLPVLEEKLIEPEEVKADPDAYERISAEETFEIKVDPQLGPELRRQLALVTAEQLQRYASADFPEGDEKSASV